MMMIDDGQICDRYMIDRWVARQTDIDIDR